MTSLLIPHSIIAKKRQQKHNKRIRIIKANLPQIRSGSNSPIRSYDPVKRNLQLLAYELHIFETIIKSMNTTLHNRIGEIFYLETLFEALEDNQLLNLLLFLQSYIGS